MRYDKHTGWVVGCGFTLGGGFSKFKTGRSERPGTLSFSTYGGFKNIFLSSSFVLQSHSFPQNQTKENHVFQYRGFYNLVGFANSLSYRYRVSQYFSILSGIGLDLFQGTLRESSGDSNKPSKIISNHSAKAFTFFFAGDFDFRNFDWMSAYSQGPLNCRLSLQYSNYGQDPILAHSILISVGLILNIEFYKDIGKVKYEERQNRWREKGTYLFD